MHRFHVSMSGVLILVLIAAVNFGAFRGAITARAAFQAQRMPLPDVPDPTPFLVFAAGVVPMASLLGLLAWHAFQKRNRGQENSSFHLGFQMGGWAGMFLAFSTCMLALRTMEKAFEVTSKATVGPILQTVHYDAWKMPNWVDFGLEWTSLILFLIAPQILLATLVGLWTRRLGLRLVVGPPRQIPEANAHPAPTTPLIFSGTMTR